VEEILVIGLTTYDIDDCWICFQNNKSTLSIWLCL